MARAVRCRRPSARCRGLKRINCPDLASTSRILMEAARRRSASQNFVQRRPPCSRCNRAWCRRIRRTGISPSSDVIAKDYLLDVRYVGNKGTHLPRFIEANPVGLRAGRECQQQQQRRQYTTCNAAGICNYGSVGLLADDSSSTYHALRSLSPGSFTVTELPGVLLVSRRVWTTSPR